MIIGTGIDILEIDRIEKLAGEAFCMKMFTQREMEYLKCKKAESLAGYFCAKEAVAKALGTGFSGMSFKDIEILKMQGKPYVLLHGHAVAVAKAKGVDKIELSISHSKTHATAMAVAETSEKPLSNIDKSIYPLNLIKRREPDSHKGDFGRIYIVGGCHEMSGAVALCAKAAFRAGAGFVTCVVQSSLIDRIGSNLAETTFLSCDEQNGFLNLNDNNIDTILKKADVLALGVGLGNNEMFSQKLPYILKNYSKTLLIDADGINILSTMKQELKNAVGNVILTPHLGEMSKLTGKSIDEIKENRLPAAKDFAKEFRSTLLLKGNQTIVTDGERVYENHTGNAGMAVGGSGDALTGTIAALAGQGYEPFDAASLGACIHGLAGDLAYEKFGYGLIASDLIENLGVMLRAE